MAMLYFPDPAKLKTKKIVFEDVIAARDPFTLEQLKELSSKRQVIEKTINETSMITEAVAREMSGGLTTKSQQDLHKLKQYLPLLENLIFHLDEIISNRQVIHCIINLRIQWGSALGSSLSLLNLMGPKYYQVDNIRFELGMSLFLYGAILRERAYEISPVDLVQSATHFREAAGIYLFLAQKVLPTLQSSNTGQKPPEATASVASIMNLVCLAEAQVAAIRKAEQRKTTAGLLAKLHNGVAEFLNEATSILYSGIVEVKDVSPRLFDYISSFKSLHELKSHGYFAEDFRGSGQVGLAIGVLREAIKKAQMKIAGEESWKIVVKKEIDDASDTLAKLERENEFVWHEKIPCNDELPSPQVSKIVSAIPYQPTRHERQLDFKF